MEVSLAGGARLGLRFGPEPLAELCQVNPEAMLALVPAGYLIVMSPTGSETGALPSWPLIAAIPVGCCEDAAMALPEPQP